MKIDVGQLRDKKTVKLSGGEEWLRAIRDSYQDMKEPLSGIVEISLLDEYDRCSVDVDISLCPVVVCGQCSEPMGLAITVRNRYFFVDGEDPLLKQREVELESTDLDLYYLDQGELDLESFINEIVNLEMPNLIQHSTPDHPCTQARLLRDGAAAYADDRQASNNPFSVLKKLKN